MAAMEEHEIRQALADRPGWAHEGGALVRTVEFDGFADAVAFVVRLGFAAEAADHHPDLDLRYRRVRVALSTHSEGGVTSLDLELAGVVDALAGGG